ncbi:hypothetical protein [Tateyamaria sp. syn59]|uniref:hypothetical protein n=1 Tax=Tateyamaria sp. syn59 TaxID=2576942 RepID=UPI0011BDC50E|nr:hypothetical protein [Tateyamaria sp. syn59]
MFRHMPLGAAIVLAMSPASAERSVEQRLIEDFADMCIAQVTSGNVVSSLSYQEMTEPQIRALATSFSFGAVPEAVWFEPSGKWFRVQQDVNVPELCEFFAVGANPKAIVSAWNAEFGEAYRSRSAARTRTTASGIRAGGFNSKPHEDGFVQVSFNTFRFEETDFLILVALKIGKTPASCDLWPEECD